MPMNHEFQPETGIDPETFDRLWQINVKGMLLAARHAIPAMRSLARNATEQGHAVER